MTQIKIVIASQSRVIHLYKKIKHKILKGNANIQFNKECLKFDLSPDYANRNSGVSDCVYNYW
jgi:hypothetical protein